MLQLFLLPISAVIRFQLVVVVDLVRFCVLYFVKHKTKHSDDITDVLSAHRKIHRFCPTVHELCNKCSRACALSFSMTVPSNVMSLVMQTNWASVA